MKQGKRLCRRRACSTWGRVRARSHESFIEGDFAMGTNPLLELQKEGVSVWLDYLSRDQMKAGGLQKLISNDGLRGETSNPSIFQKSISEGQSYNTQIN